MTRPPGTRTEKAQVWLTPQEKALWNLLADQQGVTFSDWMRRAGNKTAAEDIARGNAP